MTEVAEAWKKYMEKITCTIVEHRGKTCIGLHFPFNQEIRAQLKKSPGILWSRTHQCWYLPKDAQVFSRLQKLLDGKVYFEDKNGNAFLCQEMKEDNTISTVVEKKQISESLPVKVAERNIVLSPENLEALKQYRCELILKSYSASTMRTYINEFRSFLQTIRHNPAKSFTSNRMKDYLQYCFEKLNLSENTMHSRINALKFYYEQVLGREKFFWEIPRPKKQKQLPCTFNKDEIAAIINSTENIKHKTMLMLAYSGGLRVSEIVSIKTYQIDSQRMTIFIKQAKGKKDRVLTLSPVMLVMLREYAKAYKPEKSGYLFEGSQPGISYSTRSLQEVLQAAKKRAGVMKPGSIHSLRHSFATHLIEKGTDVTMIQKLLGHNDLKTTMIYLHTSNKDLLKIISPLDDLKLT